LTATSTGAACDTRGVITHFLVFVGVSAIVIVLPGPDTVVVTKNLLLHGRRTALASSVGVGAGLSMWTLAAAVGIASLLKASAVAFTVLKLGGAAYLIWIGVQAFRAAGHPIEGAPGAAGVSASGQTTAGRLAGFRQGMLSDLANPKIGIFFTSLLPQFVDTGRPVLLPSLILGAVFVAMTVAWLALYCVLAARLIDTITRPSVRAVMDRITGTVLIALGLRLAAEHR
jgi:threonine/homoserine/homoserine lactone efflux protein